MGAQAAKFACHTSVAAAVIGGSLLRTPFWRYPQPFRLAPRCGPPAKPVEPLPIEMPGARLVALPARRASTAAPAPAVCAEEADRPQSPAAIRKRRSRERQREGKRTILWRTERRLSAKQR